MNTDPFAVAPNQNEAPVIQYLDRLILAAEQKKVTDIHIDQTHQSGRVRWRHNGLCETRLRPPKHLTSAIINRLKCLAGLDMTCQNRPQEGGFIHQTHQALPIRLSTCPTAFYEHISMRLLYPDAPLLSKLGLPHHALKACKKALNENSGLIVLSGQTGSGKSTTLHAMLEALPHEQRHIISIEDPVERHTPHWTQISIKAQLGLDPTAVLKSILRQDPDVIMVGEVRDTHMAKSLQQAVESGHLVLTSCHAAEPIAAIARLCHLGFDPYILGMHLKLSLHQAWYTPAAQARTLQFNYFAPNQQHRREIAKSNFEALYPLEQDP